MSRTDRKDTAPRANMSERSKDDNDSPRRKDKSEQPHRNENSTMTNPEESMPAETPPQAESAATEGEQERPTESPPASTDTAQADEVEAAQPTELPPSAAESQEGFGASTWHSNKKITALWSIDQNRNSWIHITDVGWKQLADNSDSAVVALTTLGAQAKQMNATVNVYEDGGKITQIYVW